VRKAKNQKYIKSCKQKPQKPNGKIKTAGKKGKAKTAGKKQQTKKRDLGWSLKKYPKKDKRGTV